MNSSKSAWGMGGISGSHPSGQAPLRGPVAPRVDPGRIELNRVFAMDAAWDEAAEALRRLDFQAFDRAMVRFNREAGTAQQAPVTNR